jgi:poly(beta-D-mannuronate) C5 epimerase
MSSRKTPLRLLLLLAALACATLSSLTLAGKGPWPIQRPVHDNWKSPTAYAESADNPLPPRNRIRMQPDQFDVVTNRKLLNGTPIGNILLQKDRVDMLVGSQVVWSGPLRSVPGLDGRVTFPGLTALVARSPHPDWLKSTAPGVYQLSAGLVGMPGTRLEVTAPDVSQVHLVSQPYVYIAGVGASALFQNVKVSSWLPAKNQPDTNAYNHRPFIAYDDGGRLDVSGSEFSYLGTDASKAYSVSWGSGTTGVAEKSVFDHNLFGAYTGQAVGVTFRSNVFRDNARYGLDPHTDSSGLTIVDNEAYGNNTHGIIFSKNVNHSVIMNNRSHDNGSNGIMLDEKCDFDVIKDNDVWNNRGGGIVVQGSSHAVVEDNRSSGNQVGIRVNANELGFADGTRVSDNQLKDNDRGIQVYGGSRDTVVEGNSVQNSADTAIDFADPATSQSDTITGAHKGLVVARTATVRQLTTADVGRGLVLAQGARATVESSAITGQDVAVEVAPEAHIGLYGAEGGALSTVTGARKGLLVSGTADLKDVAISNVARGVLVDSGGTATIDSTSIVTSSKGVEVQGFNGRSRVRLESDDIRAPDPLVGSTLWQESGNTLSAIPSWLALAGAVFVSLAVLLHIGHRLLMPESHVRHEWRPGHARAVTDT